LEKITLSKVKAKLARDIKRQTNFNLANLLNKGEEDDINRKTLV
jgi:hypothetical protein